MYAWHKTLGSSSTSIFLSYWHLWAGVYIEMNIFTVTWRTACSVFYICRGHMTHSTSVFYIGHGHMTHGTSVFYIVTVTWRMACSAFYICRGHMMHGTFCVLYMPWSHDARHVLCSIYMYVMVTWCTARSVFYICRGHMMHGTFCVLYMPWSHDARHFCVLYMSQSHDVWHVLCSIYAVVTWRMASSVFYICRGHMTYGKSRVLYNYSATLSKLNVPVFKRLYSCRTCRVMWLDTEVCWLATGRYSLLKQSH